MLLIKINKIIKKLPALIINKIKINNCVIQNNVIISRIKNLLMLILIVLHHVRLIHTLL